MNHLIGNRHRQFHLIDVRQLHALRYTGKRNRFALGHHRHVYNLRSIAQLERNLCGRLRAKVGQVLHQFQNAQIAQGLTQHLTHKAHRQSSIAGVHRSRTTGQSFAFMRQTRGILTVKLSQNALTEWRQRGFWIQMQYTRRVAFTEVIHINLRQGFGIIIHHHDVR